MHGIRYCDCPRKGMPPNRRPHSATISPNRSVRRVPSWSAPRGLPPMKMRFVVGLEVPLRRMLLKSRFGMN